MYKHGLTVFHIISSVLSRVISTELAAVREGDSMQKHVGVRALNSLHCGVLDTQPSLHHDAHDVLPTPPQCKLLEASLQDVGATGCLVPTVSSSLC